MIRQRIVPVTTLSGTPGLAQRFTWEGESIWRATRPSIFLAVFHRLAFPAFFIATACTQPLSREHINDLIRRCIWRNLVSDHIWNHRQARALPPQSPGYRLATLVPVTIPFVTNSSAVATLFHSNKSNANRRRLPATGIVEAKDSIARRREALRGGPLRRSSTPTRRPDR